MSDCTREDKDCSSCSLNCSERKPGSMLIAPGKNSFIKKTIAVVSGKGGVGKSLVTGLLAVLASRRGLHTGILDADITGPSIPKMFGITEKAFGDEKGIIPVKSASGIEIMSLNLLLENDTDPVMWRGPMIAGAVKQFWTDVVWKDIDVLFIDCPPGTGDVPLTVFQSVPVDGIIVVASPQDLVRIIVEKAVKMAEKMNVPVLGLVENMAWFQCPECGAKHRIFGDSHGDEIRSSHSIPAFAQIPVDGALADLCDRGLIEDFGGNWLDELSALITKQDI